MVRRFAERTKVSVTQTRADIEATLSRYGCDSFAFSIEPARAVLVFKAEDRQVRFTLPLGDKEIDRKRAWRALFLCLKARLEGVASGIETFEEAFLAHVVMPDGQTVGQHTLAAIATAYKSGRMQPLLEAPRKGEHHGAT
jgi:hypothetical protein